MLKQIKQDLGIWIKVRYENKLFNYQGICKREIGSSIEKGGGAKTRMLKLTTRLKEKKRFQF